MLNTYRKDPCRTLSIPYWKNKRIKLPPNMKIAHHSEYAAENHPEYRDEPYFRLFHDLKHIEDFSLNNISIVTAATADIPTLADIINRSYTDLSVTIPQLEGYTRTEVYCPDLWVMAVDRSTSTVVGCGIADLDREVGEGILEWIQVLPEYRRQGIGQAIVTELLRRMTDTADFATVSGKVNNITQPEKLYRRCGFTGDDIWHILTKIED